MEFVQGGELFSHLYKSEHFNEDQVRFYIGIDFFLLLILNSFISSKIIFEQFYIAEIIVALEQLHNVS
jgi:hypothetical protein